MKNGFRIPPQASKKDQLKNIDTELKNLQMAGRISQMMVQQLLQNYQAMSQDLGSALNQLYELQYKYTAIQKHLNLPVEALNEIANQQRLVDFNDASAKADVTDGLVSADEVSAQSTVVITSTAKDDQGNDRGVFRSRLKLSESGSKELMEALPGKKVGDKVQVKLADVQHEVEILSVKNPSQVEVVEAAQETAH